MRTIKILAAVALFSAHCYAAESIERDIPYTQSSDEYAAQRCKLDVKYEKGQTEKRVLVWFHGGGITSGNKHFPQNISKDFVIVAANYRLSPKANAKNAIEDAADAVAWTFKNIEKFGGDPKKIFISGHSAGAYLCGMVAFNPRYLKERGIKKYRHSRHNTRKRPSHNALSCPRRLRRQNKQPKTKNRRIRNSRQPRQSNPPSLHNFRRPQNRVSGKSGRKSSARRSCKKIEAHWHS